MAKKRRANSNQMSNALAEAGLSVARPKTGSVEEAYKTIAEEMDSLEVYQQDILLHRLSRDFGVNSGAGEEE